MWLFLFPSFPEIISFWSSTKTSSLSVDSRMDFSLRKIISLCRRRRRCLFRLPHLVALRACNGLCVLAFSLLFFARQGQQQRRYRQLPQGRCSCLLLRLSLSHTHNGHNRVDPSQWTRIIVVTIIGRTIQTRLESLSPFPSIQCQYSHTTEWHCVGPPVEWQTVLVATIGRQGSLCDQQQ